MHISYISFNKNNQNSLLEIVRVVLHSLLLLAPYDYELKLYLTNFSKSMARK